MSSTPQTPSTSQGACRLCDTLIPEGADRCPECGLHAATDVPPESRWQLIAGMVIVYAVVALLVLLTR